MEMAGPATAEVTATVEEIMAMVGHTTTTSTTPATTTTTSSVGTTLITTGAVPFLLPHDPIVPHLSYGIAL